MIQRVNYLKKLAVWREKQFIKVVSGVRRCGKSTLLSLYIDWLKRTGVTDEQIVFINLEEPEYDSLLNYQGLYSYIIKRLRNNQYTYIFIDEAQQCNNFEKAVEGLVIKQFVDLYISGSNAHIFSGGFAALLEGKYVEITMLPLSFAEYLAFSRANSPQRIDELKMYSRPPVHEPGAAAERRLPRQKPLREKYLQREAFNEYLSFGAFPYTAALGTEPELIKTYVDGVYNTILIKDLAKWADITDFSLLERIAKMLSHSMGSPVSAKKISDSINASGRKISVNTVDAYMRALSNGFIFYHVGRYDIKGGQYLKTLGKYYIVDTGLRNMLLESSAPDLDSQLESIVYMELLRRGCQVSIGKFADQEINFVAGGANTGQPVAEQGEAPGGMAYYQVAASVTDSADLARKLEPLERIRDNHPKYVLSLDDTLFRTNHNGIIRRNLINWLLEKPA